MTTRKLSLTPNFVCEQHRQKSMFCTLQVTYGACYLTKLSNWVFSLVIWYAVILRVGFAKDGSVNSDPDESNQIKVASQVSFKTLWLTSCIKRTSWPRLRSTATPECRQRHGGGTPCATRWASIPSGMGPGKRIHVTMNFPKAPRRTWVGVLVSVLAWNGCNCCSSGSTIRCVLEHPTKLISFNNMTRVSF